MAMLRRRRHRYFALNKPREVVTTASDPQRRRTVLDFVPGLRERVWPVGRLDYHSEGVSVEHRNQFMGLRGIENSVTRLENVFVPKENLIGGEGEGKTYYEIISAASVAPEV